MKRKTIMEKGITLIALIITIVVLMILAAVAISSIQNDGILSYANNAATGYKDAQEEEQDMLQEYLQFLENENSGGATPWKDNGDGTFTKDGVTVQIGDPIEYSEGYDSNNLRTSSIDETFVMKNLHWRVLGINEAGQLELISTQPTDSLLNLSGENDYLTAVTKLDTLCNDLYGKGEGAASARSLKVEDINKLAGIKTDDDIKALSSTDDYGTWYRYKYDTTEEKIQYSKSQDYNPETGEGTWTEYANINQTKFKEPGKDEINSSNYQDAEGNPIVAELKNGNYTYNIAEKVTGTTKDNISIASLITQGLKKDENGTDVAGEDYLHHWLASQFEYGAIGGALFELRTVYSGKVFSEAVCNDEGGGTGQRLRVRPVVTLKLDVELVDSDNNGVLEVNGVPEEFYMEMDCNLVSSGMITSGVPAIFKLIVDTNDEIVTKNVAVVAAKNIGGEQFDVEITVEENGTNSYLISVDTSSLSGTWLCITITAGSFVTANGHESLECSSNQSAMIMS